jgi:hypothetical protein
MHERSQAASIVLLTLLGCASKSSSSAPTTWYPIPGVSVAPWEQAEAICGPILQQGAIAGRGGTRAAENAKAQYRACMGQHGWTDQAPKARNEARSVALDQDAEELSLRLGDERTTDGRLGIGPVSSALAAVRASILAGDKDERR